MTTGAFVVVCLTHHPGHRCFCFRLSDLATSGSTASLEPRVDLSPSFVAMSAFGITSTSVAVYDATVIRSSSISNSTSSFPLLFLIGLVGIAWYLLSGKGNTCKAAGVDKMIQTEPYVPNQYGCCLHEQLMKLCFERGLPQTRTKSSMVQSLAWYDATNTCDRATVWPSWHERDIHRTVSLRAAVDHSKTNK